MEVGADIFAKDNAGSNLLHTMLDRFDGREVHPDFMKLVKRLFSAGLDPCEVNFLGNKFFLRIRSKVLRAKVESLHMSVVAEKAMAQVTVAVDEHVERPKRQRL